MFNWRYSEVGEFIDTEGFTFTDRFVDSGMDRGPGRSSAAFASRSADVLTVGGELRYQKAEGKGLLDEDFLGDKIDLGGWTTSFTFHLGSERRHLPTSKALTASGQEFSERQERSSS